MKFADAWKDLKEWATNEIGGPFGELLSQKMEELEERYE
jgi:hypothetical protein